ncbi:MAG: glycosyltransferase family 4 protein [Anaerolineae bacterium]|nr:glycosyltransferase family 4 protein [Anaerolineae bacterium]
MAKPLLFADHVAGLGGAEQSLLLLIKHLNPSRWHTHLACPPGTLAERATSLGASVHAHSFPRLRRNPSAFIAWIRHSLALARLARRVDAVVLITNTVRATLYGALASRMAGVPLIWYMRDFWLSESRPQHAWADRALKRALCRSARWVIANSLATARHLPCTTNVRVIHNGIEVTRYMSQADAKSLRAAFGLPSDVLVIGMVGRLRPWKGQERFLRVLAQVRQQRSDVYGLIVGGTPFNEGGDYPQRLRCLAEELGLTSYIVFTGHLDDVRPAIGAMDIFVHPGDPEPFGLVNIEAMAMEKPVVAFAHGALPEIVVEGATGFLIEPTDEAAMAQTILRLLDDPGLRYALGQAGRARVEAQFNASRVTAEFEAVLNAL